MARAGDCIESPILQERIVFRQTARDTGGALLQFDDYQAVGAPGPVEHLHLRQAERLTVVSGSMLVRVGGQERRLIAGEAVDIPPGVPHRWRNVGTDELHVLTDFRPALDLERFFELIFGLARDGKTDATGTPRFLQIAAMSPAYGIYLPAPPLPLQRALFALLGPIARLRGYRPWYPAYSSIDPPMNRTGTESHQA